MKKHINIFASKTKYKPVKNPEWYRKAMTKIGSLRKGYDGPSLIRTILDFVISPVLKIVTLVAQIIFGLFGAVLWFLRNIGAAMKADSENRKRGYKRPTFYTVPYILVIALITVGCYKVSTFSPKQFMADAFGNVKTSLFHKAVDDKVSILPTRVKEYGEQGKDLADDTIDKIKTGAGNTIIWMGENVIANEDPAENKDAKTDSKAAEEVKSEDAKSETVNNEPDVVVNPKQVEESQATAPSEETKKSEEAPVTEAPKTKMIEPVSTVFEENNVNMGPETLDPAIQKTVEDMMKTSNGEMTNPDPDAANNEGTIVRRAIEFH